MADRSLPSGPGKLSRRVDKQPIRTPPLAEADVVSGDIGQLRDLQRVAPAPRGAAEQIRSAPVKTRPDGAPLTGARIPPEAFQMPTSRPGEPVTAGLPTGPGPGPEVLSQPATDDLRELVLQFLSQNFANDDATQMLQDYRTRKAQAQVPTYGPPAGAPGLAPMAQPASLDSILPAEPLPPEPTGPPPAAPLPEPAPAPEPAPPAAAPPVAESAPPAGPTPPSQEPPA